MTAEELKRYPLAFDGKNCIGPNVCDVVYVWTENDVPCYVGITSKEIHHRCNQHIGSKRQLFSRKVQGCKDAFKCYIVDQFYKNAEQKESYQYLLDLETYYISQFGTYHYDNQNAYNLTTGGEGCYGHKHSETTKQMISERQTGIKRKPISEKHRQQISEKLKGRTLSPEVKQNMSLGQLGHTVSEQTRNKISIANSNPSEETRKKISDAAKSRQPISDETKAKLSISKIGNSNALGFKHSEETKLKVSKASKEYWKKRKQNMLLPS